MSEETDNNAATRQQAVSFMATLFGAETVKLASRIDTANLNMNDAMTKAIGAGVKQLKTLHGDLKTQQEYIASLEEGTRLLLCLWIMDMELSDKLR